MRSRALNLAFNRALTDAAYRQALFLNLRRTLLEAGVSETEIAGLETHAPDSLESLARALEATHVSPFTPQR